MKNDNWNSEVIASTKNLKFWTILWVVSMAIATFGRIFFWDGNTGLNIVAILINLVFGTGMILANRN